MSVAMIIPRQFRIESLIKGLTACIGMLSFAALTGYIHLEYSLIFLLLFAVAIYREFKGISVSRRLLTIFSIAVVLFFLFTLNKDDFVTEMLEALLMLLGIKFLELEQVRDYMQIYAISLFLLSGIGLFTLGVIFVVYLLLFVFLLSIAFVFLTYYAQDPNLELTRETARKMVLKCLYIPILAIPLSALMFVILPRAQYPLLDFLNRPGDAKTGFTDRVRLGEISSIQEDASVIFRAHMEKIDEALLYWRGITLDYFDGTSWNTSEKTALTAVTEYPSHPRMSGRILKQTIYLEPYQNVYLFGLDKPLFMSQRRAKRRKDLTYVSPATMERRIRYEVTSAISDTIAEEKIDVKTYLQLPARLSPKIVELVRSLTSTKSQEESVSAIFRYLKSGQYGYSLESLPVSKNPLESFLFETKRGNCEYFASAMAVMLRIAKIPSRLIGGYHGGYYNDMGDYYIVPQKTAHVWVEAFIAGRGWVRLDPTPASTDVYTFPGKNTFLHLQIFFDTINYYWYGIVINYNLEKQLSIAHTFMTGFRKPSFNLSLSRRRILAIVLVLALTTSIIFLARRFLLNKMTPENRVIGQFLRRMEKHGYNRRDCQGLEEFVASVADSEVRTYACRFVTEFEKTYYHDKKFDRGKINALKEIIRQIPSRV
ncbi:MAG TPA: DUF3488 and transglutaminase-like domain-containing protein [Syntrophorhabdaceae bacterium]|nr:DUF3488 and transglutaminase-like domain-containing protein [Syntrophorhabdaceae bacterium]